MPQTRSSAALRIARWRAENPTRVAEHSLRSRARRWALARLGDRYPDEYRALIRQYMSEHENGQETG